MLLPPLHYFHRFAVILITYQTLKLSWVLIVNHNLIEASVIKILWNCVLVVILKEEPCLGHHVEKILLIVFQIGFQLLLFLFQILFGGLYFLCLHDDGSFFNVIICNYQCILVHPNIQLKFLTTFNNILDFIPLSCVLFMIFHQAEYFLEVKLTFGNSLSLLFHLFKLV